MWKNSAVSFSIHPKYGASTGKVLCPVRGFIHCTICKNKKKNRRNICHVMALSGDCCQCSPDGSG